MTNSPRDVLALAGRLLLSLIFIQGGVGKLMAMDGTVAYIGAAGLPFPMAAYVVAVAVELGGGLLILFGFQTFLASLTLAAFCLVTGLAFHLQPGNMGQMINLWKNVAMAGGFLKLAAFGPGSLSLDAQLRSQTLRTA